MNHEDNVKSILKSLRFETLDNLGETYGDNAAALKNRISELEGLKREYSGGGFKKMRATLNSGIRKLRDMLNKLTLEESFSHINFVPLDKRSTESFEGLEVKFVSASDDHAIVIQDIGFLRVRVRTFGRLACRDTVP